ncbi:MAG: neutral zinc metallopeptidase [Sphingomonadaceae bacterium]|nr:neutral zinc metallopeptidase [Sphingomonadaceae bacterium]
MRLDDYRESDNVGDQRGENFGGGGFNLAGGGGGLLFLIASRFGIGGVLLLFLLMFLFGGNPLSLVGGGGSQVGSGGQQTQVGHAVAQKACGADAASAFSCRVLASAEDTWGPIMQQQGVKFFPADLIFYAGNGMSGCGAAQSAMGPFYCPTDNRIYLDTEFFRELDTRFHAAGDFAQAYVIAHEYGHHIQYLLGIADKVRAQQEQASSTQGNALQVRMELQADCFAGVWGNRNKDRLDPGDIEEGLRAANAIGDDTLQKEAQGRVVPDSFTHGTSAQRVEWLKKGLDSGDPAQCDTFAAGADA